MQILRPYLRIILLIGFSAWLAACGSSSSSDGDDSDASSDNSCGTVVDVDSNSSVDATLENGDCLAEDLLPGAGGDSSFVDEYRVTLTSGGTLKITMTSTDLDPFLILLNTSESCADGCDLALLITFDDDSAGSEDAFISVDLAAGTYGIGANSVDPGTGDYSLIVEF